MDKFFSSSEFSIVKSENNSELGEKESVRGEKTLARLTSGYLFLLAKPEFYSHSYLHPCKKKKSTNLWRSLMDHMIVLIKELYRCDAPDILHDVLGDFGHFQQRV
jgi:hypothetical protein